MLINVVRSEMYDQIKQLYFLEDTAERLEPECLLASRLKTKIVKLKIK